MLASLGGIFADSSLTAGLHPPQGEQPVNEVDLGVMDPGPARSPCQAPNAPSQALARGSLVQMQHLSWGNYPWCKFDMKS